MYKIELMILSSLMFLFACHSHDVSERPYTGPEIIETTGDVVPPDSMENPVVVALDYAKLEKVRAGKPKMVPLRSNVIPAGKPKVVKAGRPKICTPGQDSFLMPKIVAATFETVLAESPEIVLAKEATSKDENPYSFGSLGVKNGLNSNCITSIYEDKSGNIWIGMCAGSGVTKYDGKYFTTYNVVNGRSGVGAIMEDKAGNMWFGTSEKGLLKYNGKHYTTFTNPDIPKDIQINSLLEDQTGNIWVGTNGAGLIKFDGSNLTHFTQKQGLPNDAVNKIIQDKNGNIWLGTDDGLSKFDGSSFYNYGKNEGLSNTQVTSILEDKAGFMWLSTYGGGVFKFDQESFIQYSEKEGLGNNYIASSVQDIDKNLWFHSYEKGLSKFDGYHFTNFSNGEMYASNGGESIVCDKLGKIWFGTFTDGVIKYSGNQFEHLIEKDGLLSNIITAITKENTENFWLGCMGGGVVRIAKNEVMQITKNEGLHNSNIWALYVDKSDQVWIATLGGLIKYDGKYFTKITPKNGPYEIQSYSILEDLAGNLWIGIENGLIKYRDNSMTYFSGKNDFGNKTIYAMMEDKNKNIWLGTDKGVSKLIPSVSKDSVKYSITDFTEKHGIPNGKVRSIFEDSFGNIWVGTLGGLSKLIQNGKKDYYSITNITTRQGLSSNEIFSIYQDKSENLWFGTSSGLDKLTPEKLKLLDEKISSKSISDSDVFFKNYNQSDGFYGIGVLGGKTIQEDKNGKIWIGALDRLTIYDPKGESSDTTSPVVQLMGISIYNENIDWIDLANKKDNTITLGNGVRLRNFDFDSTGKWYGVPQNLSLASNNNYVTFKYVGVTQNQPHKVKYKYQLAGLDDNWSGLTDKNEAQYGNLPPGSYTFMVKSMNSDGVWSEPLEYTLAIRPPWYRTWWAYSIYLVLLLFFGWKLHIYQKTKTINKEREKARERVLQHAREIEIAYTKLGTAHENLKSTQAQLIQSEKMASLGELTAGIAHEIQNPLNFVNNFSEVSIDLAKELMEEVEKLEISQKDKEYVNDIIGDLSSNQEKINHHGKRASSIVKAMLEHSRTSTGHKEPTDINALCDEYLRLSYQGLRAKDKDFNANMETHFDPSIPKIEVIPQDIGRVILNLIGNAFYAVNDERMHRLKADEGPGDLQMSEPQSGRAADDGYTPRVTISTKLSDGKIEISIKDNGPGIPDSIKDKIFQPFFTTKPTGQGTGLGLSLSHDIVKAHGGELNVFSKVGEGTEFVIQLLLAK